MRKWCTPAPHPTLLVNRISKKSFKKVLKIWGGQLLPKPPHPSSTKISIKKSILFFKFGELCPRPPFHKKVLNKWGEGQPPPNPPTSLSPTHPPRSCPVSAVRSQDQACAFNSQALWAWDAIVFYVTKKV